MGPPDRDTEHYLLDYFLPARELVTGSSLSYLRSGESPDFICVRGDGVQVGVEVTRITLGPYERLTDEQVHDELLRLIAQKETKRTQPHWTLPERTVLVIGMMENTIESIEWLLPNDVMRDFSGHGFIEVWLGDYTLEDAHGDIELFGLYPSKWWGHHKRRRTGRKPYG